MGRRMGRLARTVASIGCAWAGLSMATSAAPVEGLIVKLKDAPTHERLARLGAEKAARAEGDRLQRVLQLARVTEARTRAAGRDAQWLDFGRALSRSEADTLAARLRERSDVEWVEPNVRERRLQQALPTPNDLYFPYRTANDPGQWWLRPAGDTTGGLLPSYGAPGVQGAWRWQTGQPSAVVAVLDTGITSHPDLSGRVLPGYDFVSEAVYANDGDGRDSDPSDPGDWVSAADIAGNSAAFGSCDEEPESSWHGTTITGIVAAATNNSIGVAGVNWNGRVLPVRVAGKCGATVLDITDGMRWAAGLDVAGVPRNLNPARVINISFGGSAPCGNAYQSTVNELAALGVVVVAAAGNEQGALTRPASCNGVVGVTALARDGLKAAYSNFGAQAVIATVGGDPAADTGLLTLSNNGTQGPRTGGYANVFGTSFATPVVAGVVSLMLSANPRLSVRQIVAGLQSTALPHVQSNSAAVCSSTNYGACVCTTSTCGAGVLNAEGAVRYAMSAPYDANGGSAGGGGGGALGPWWLAGLALAVLTLAAMRWRAWALRSARRG